MTNFRDSWFKPLKQLPLNYLVLMVLLFCLCVASILPQILGRQWSWIDSPKIPNLGATMKNIRDRGIDLPGWTPTQHKNIDLAEGKWSLQVLDRANEPPVVLFLLPQSYHRSHPAVEWYDLNSVNRLKSDPVRIIEFSTRSGQVTARFFRGWERRTFAILQWYAYPNGGHHSASHWFWSDQWAQLSGNRVPWVAVSVQMRIEPSKNLEDVRPQMIKLAQLVQNSLEEQFFNRLKSQSSS